MLQLTMVMSVSQIVNYNYAGTHRKIQHGVFTIILFLLHSIVYAILTCHLFTEELSTGQGYRQRQLTRVSSSH